MSCLLVAACGGTVDQGNGGDDAGDGGNGRDAASGGDGGVCADGGSPIYDCMGNFTYCCPAGAHCDPPSNIQCLTDGGGVGAACQTSSDCHKSNADECNICAGSTSLVCHAGACVCACQVGD